MVNRLVLISKNGHPKSLFKVEAHLDSMDVPT